ncbi:MAG: plastocyanin/azurin family copper-binding protein [Thermoplasmata archaeon]
MRGRLLALVLLVTLVVASASLWTIPAPEVRAQTNLTITMRDSLAFEPASFTVAPGESVSLTLVNGGGLQHTFTLFAQADANVPVNDPSALQAYFNANTRIVHMTFNGGEQDSTSFTAPTTEGTYTIVCMIAGHAAGGMHGTMRVTSTPGDSPAPIDPLFIGIIIAVVVIVIAVAAVFVLRRRS